MTERGLVEEMARNLHYLGVTPGREDAIARELVDRFGWRKGDDPLIHGRVIAQQVNVASDQIIGGIPVAIVGQTVDGHAILGHTDRLQRRDRS
jgi:hypothetical protein